MRHRIEQPSCILTIENGGGSRDDSGYVRLYFKTQIKN